MSTYFYKEDPDTGRVVYRVEQEDDESYTMTVPLSTHFGCRFHGWGRERRITKKWFNRQKGFKQMPDEMAMKYDSIEKGDSTSILFDE